VTVPDQEQAIARGDRKGWGMSSKLVGALVVVGVTLFAAPSWAQAPVFEVNAASELPVWKTVTLGQHRGVDAVRNALDKPRIAIGDTADEVLGRPAFSFSSERRELDLVLVSVAQLGFGARGATLADIHARALGLGLDLCPEEVGPQLRLQYRNQPVGEFLHIAMKPQRTYQGAPIDFSLANSGAGLALLGGSASPELVISASVRFVFVRPSAYHMFLLTADE
jgi:hypothetical protein